MSEDLPPDVTLAWATTPVYLNTRDLRFQELIYRLTVATLDNDWGAMQSVQRDLLVHYSNVGEAKQALYRVMPDAANGPMRQHCKFCGDLEDRHDSGGKCLFDTTHYEPCSVRLPIKSIDFMREGKKIDAIKEYRSATASGLKDAKDIILAEAANHGWFT